MVQIRSEMMGWEVEVRHSAFLHHAGEVREFSLRDHPLEQHTVQPIDSQHHDRSLRGAQSSLPVHRSATAARTTTTMAEGFVTAG